MQHGTLEQLVNCAWMQRTAAGSLEAALRKRPEDNVMADFNATLPGRRLMAGITEAYVASTRMGDVSTACKLYREGRNTLVVDRNGLSSVPVQESGDCGIITGYSAA